MMFGALLSAPVFAGGADVSTDEIYSDGVTLTAHDGAALDIDGDGNTDLAVASNRSGPAERSRYYLGNGDGTFSAPVLLTAAPSSIIVAAPLDNDSFIDLVQGRRDLTDIWYLGDGAGGVGAGSAVAAGDTTRTLALAAGDLDGDGDLDLVTGNGSAGGTTTDPQVNRFYLNDFIPSATVAFTGADISADADISRTVALADIDGDTDLDVIVGNDHTTLNSSRIYLNQLIESGLPVSFAAGIDFGPANDLTTQILIGDLDNDGKPDIVALNAVSGASPGVNRFFMNTSTPGDIQISVGTDVSADTDRTNGGTLADFDGDGDLDLAVANFLASNPSQSSRNRLYLNQFIPTGTVGFAAGLDISTDEHQSHDLTAADLNGDLRIDIVVGNSGDVTGVSRRDRRYLNNGTADPFANVVPVIDGQANTLETDEETDLTIVIDDVDVTDPDNLFPGDFTLTVQPGDNYTFTDNTITPNAGFDGELAVPVVVNDGTDDSDAFDLTVTVNNTLNSAPSFISSPVTDAAEGVAYAYNVTATDPDVGDILAIIAPTAPAWLNFVDNGDGTATLTGTPAAGDVGDHNVSLEVSDGADTAQQSFTITVEAAPPPPPPPPPAPPSSGGGGGSLGFLTLLALGTIGAGRKRRANNG
jgi:hypothetical protein